MTKADLDRMTLEEIRTRLQDRAAFPTKKSLLELAKECGLRVGGDYGRDALVHAIYMRGFANPRGLEILSTVSHTRK